MIASLLKNTMPLTAQKAHGVFFEYFESLFIFDCDFLWTVVR